MTMFTTLDPELESLHVAALRLLKDAPHGGAGGRVIVRQWRTPDGSPVYVVEQYSSDGGWGSDQTDLRTATLASEVLAIAIGAELLVCRECDAAEEGGAK